jgi:hypothetical protein
MAWGVMPAFSHKRDSTPYSLKFYDTKSLEIFFRAPWFCLDHVIPKRLARVIYRDIEALLLSSFPKILGVAPSTPFLGDQN